MTRREWVERIRTCDEKDIPFLVAMFNDWRQEELGEDENFPEVFIRASATADRWLAEGPDLLRLQPIRELKLRDLVCFSAGTFSNPLISIRCDSGDAAIYIPLWFPPAESICGRTSRTYRDGVKRFSEVSKIINQNALNWAVEESKKEHGCDT